MRYFSNDGHIHKNQRVDVHFSEEGDRKPAKAIPKKSSLDIKMFCFKIILVIDCLDSIF